MTSRFKPMPTIADGNMINAAYMLIETMPKGTPDRHRKIVAAVWEAMCEVSPATNIGGLTKRMRQGLEVITEYIDENGISPTYSEIQALTGGRHKSDIKHIVHSLRRRGFITFEDRKQRSIRIIRRPGETK